jgi:hypothetical protein
VVAVPVARHARHLGAFRVPAVVAGFAGRLIRPARSVLANAAQIPLTIAGLGCIDAGVFTVSLTAGLIATGLTLIGLEHLIADE